MIGQLLAQSPPDSEGNWPQAVICEALEWMSSTEVAKGFEIATLNKRGIYSRGWEEGGEQERELAQKYRVFANHLSFDYPFVSEILGRIAASYDKEAQWVDADAKVRSRLYY